MNTRRFRAWAAPAAIAALTFLAACTSPQNAGEEVLPESDLVTTHYVDTFAIGFKTLLVDTTMTDGLSKCLIGNYLDEHFGFIDCQTYIQPRLQGSNLVFGTDPDNLVLDSIVLVLDLTDFYGRYNTPLPLEIFEIKEAFDGDSLHFSNDRLVVDSSYDYAAGAKLDFSGLPGFFDFVTLRLDDSLGRRLLYAPTDSLDNQTDFTTFFKGLMIRTKQVDPGQSREPGGVFAFDPRSGKTALTIFYRDNGVKEKYTFTISNASRRFHTIERSDVAGRSLADAAAAPGFGAPYGAIQAGAVVKLAVSIPHIGNIDPAGIHLAELVLPIDADVLGSENRFAPPGSVNMFIADSTGEKERDLGTFNSSVTYDATRKAYVLPMTNTVQQILSGRITNNGFIIVASNNGVSLNRVLLCGPGHPTLQPKLRVMYTKVSR